jgi:hypothetical protein
MFGNHVLLLLRLFIFYVEEIEILLDLSDSF